MSHLTYRLEQGERPSRKLCLQASQRIADLEEALIAIERDELARDPDFPTALTVPGDMRLKERLLSHVQRALYGQPLTPQDTKESEK